MMDLFWTNDYQIQFSVINALSEIVDKDNAPRVRYFLEIINIEEYSAAVQSSLKKLEVILNHQK